MGDNKGGQRQSGFGSHQPEFSNGCLQTVQSFGPVRAADNQFANHGIVEGRHQIAGARVRIQPDADARRWSPIRDATRRRGVVVGRVFGVHANLDSVPRDLDLLLLQAEPLTGGHSKLPSNQVLPRGLLGNRMLYLNTRVHLDEIKVITINVVQEFNGSSIPVPRMRRQAHGGVMQPPAGSLWNGCRRRFFNQFLVATLDGAVAFTEVDNFALAITENLHFHVACAGDETLHVQAAIAECRQCLPRCTFE